MKTLSKSKGVKELKDAIKLAGKEIHEWEEFLKQAKRRLKKMEKIDTKSSVSIHLEKDVNETKHRMYCAMSGMRCLVYHPNGICPDIRDCEACRQDNVNEMPPTILDDDIADWEHDNLESK